MSTRPPSTLLEYLPAIYRADPFIGQFLLAFEKILLGANDGVPFPELPDRRGFPEKGIEETIASLATYFDPRQAPESFLPWLSGWVALVLRADIEVQTQREFIADIVQRYQFRGTKENLEKLLTIFVRGTPVVSEPGVEELQIAVQSTLGQDTCLGGGPPHFFTVTIALAKSLREHPEDLARQLEIARAIIELEKPAHTDYELIPRYPDTIRLDDQESSVLGVNTILGDMPAPSNP